jgi:hypothetical protein
VSGVWRHHRLTLACLAIAGLIGVAAVADHTVKQRRMNRAELAEWYCVHERTRCLGASSAALEARWNERETGYVLAIAVTLGIGLAGAGLRRVTPSRP